MNKETITKMFKNVKLSVSKHRPEILTWIGIDGMVLTSVLAVKVTPKALRLIEEKKEEVDDEVLTKREIIKATWKCYIPAAVTCAVSIACLIGANSVNAKRNAALATVYKLSETAFSDYREKVIETIGEKKEQTVKDKIAEDRVRRAPVQNNEVFITEKGNTLCLEPLSGRYFKSDIDKIKKAVNELNRVIVTDMYVSLNDFYDEIGLANTDLGDVLGWNINCGLIEIYFSSQITEDDTPCIVVEHNNPPKYDYASFI